MSAIWRDFFFCRKNPRHPIGQLGRRQNGGGFPRGQKFDRYVLSAKHIKKGIKTLRTDIQKLTLDSLKKQRELEVKHFGVERNKPLYDLIETALNNRPDDKTPIQVQMPTKNGGFVPVRHIKLISESTSGIPVLGGTALAENDSMPRVDVFLEDGQYYVVPVYTMDFAKGVLPLVAQPS